MKVLSIAVVIAFVAMSCWATGEKKITPAKRTCAILPDSSTKAIYGDTISALIFSPKTVKLYKVLSGVTPADNDKTIGGYKVERELGKIEKNCYPVLQFLLADSCSYSDNKIVPAKPFMPSYAVEFAAKKDKVYLVFSFGSREFAMVRNGVCQKYQQIQNTRLFIRFFQNLVDDQFLNEQIKNIQK